MFELVDGLGNLSVDLFIHISCSVVSVSTSRDVVVLSLVIDLYMTDSPSTVNLIWFRYDWIVVELPEHHVIEHLC